MADSHLPTGLDTSDPRFLAAAAENPGLLDHLGSVVSGFSAGAYSWPFDYTLCLHWIAGTAGVYGRQVQRTCNHHTMRITTVLGHAGRLAFYLVFRGMLAKMLGNEAALHALREAISRVSGEQASELFVRHLPRMTESTARLAGRMMSGAAFTAWMQTGGRIATAPRGQAIGIASFNFVALLWGSALHVSLEHRDIDLVSIFACWLTGDPHFQLSSEQYAAVVRAVQSVEPSILASGDQGDFENYRAVMDLLVRFGQSGGDM